MFSYLNLKHYRTAMHNIIYTKFQQLAVINK